MGKGIIKVEAGKGAPLRVSPDASAEMLGALEQGTQLDLLSYGDGWYLVEVDGIRGYVAGSMVQALDGINGLGKIKIRKSKDKNGKPTATVTAIPAVVKTVVNGQKKSGLISKLKANTNSAVKAAAKNNLKNAMRATVDPKKRLETAIKNAKKAGVTEDEIKEMASLNGIGNLTDLQGVDGLKDLVKKVGSGIKNVAQKVVGTSKQITETADAVNNAQAAINNVQQQPAATQQTTAPAQQVVTVNPINNQNQSAMTEETKSKIKKIAIASAAVIGATTIGVIIYKKSKKNAAAAKGALNGVKRRKKSRKSKKNTGNKMLNLK